MNDTVFCLRMCVADTVFYVCNTVCLLLSARVHMCMDALICSHYFTSVLVKECRVVSRRVKCIQILHCGNNLVRV